MFLVVLVWLAQNLMFLLFLQVALQLVLSLVPEVLVNGPDYAVVSLNTTARTAHDMVAELIDDGFGLDFKSGYALELTA